MISVDTIETCIQVLNNISVCLSDKEVIQKLTAAIAELQKELETQLPAKKESNPASALL